MLADLHAPLLPILGQILAQTPLPRAGVVLDLGCGAGEKLPLLAHALGSDVRLLGLDHERAALRSAVALGRAATGNENQPLTPATGAWPLVCGDAHALPLRSACLDAAVCIAALGLFERPTVTIAELHRALRPQAPALFVTATQLWARIIHWPQELAHRLISTTQRADQTWPELITSPDVGGELAALLTSGGLEMPSVRAFLLRPAAHPALLELPLLAWEGVRAKAAPQLAAAELAACDNYAAQADIELIDVALAALAFKP